MTTPPQPGTAAARAQRLQSGARASAGPRARRGEALEEWVRELAGSVSFGPGD